MYVAWFNIVKICRLKLAPETQKYQVEVLKR